MFWVAYYSVFLTFLFLAKKYKNIHLLLLFIMIFFMGQRWMTGEDFPGYLLYYVSGFEGVDFTFFWFQNFFSSSGFSFSLFIFFTYAITLLLTYKFINRFQNSAFVFVLFIITELAFIQLSQIKQSLAIPFFLFAFYFIYNKKVLLGMVFAMLASSIHVGTIFLLPFLFFRVLCRKDYLNLILFIICFLPLLDVTAFIPSALYFKFSHYLDGQYNQPLSYYHYFKLYGVIILFLLLYQVNTSSFLERNRFLITGFIIYLFLYSISFKFAPLMRLSYYFRIFEVLVFVNLAMGANLRQVFSVIVVLFYSLSFLVISLVDPYNVSRYSFDFVNLYETKTEAELRFEIEQFYEE